MICWIIASMNTKEFEQKFIGEGQYPIHNVAFQCLWNSDGLRNRLEFVISHNFEAEEFMKGEHLSITMICDFSLSMAH